MPDREDIVKSLEDRVETLERQVAVLLKRTKPPAQAARSRGDYRDSYDALEYPEER
ncbi:MAG: hypothetical protein LBS30_06245 [Planctomycetota bacterium]|jgi:hypothetical protein|nr:hypothetical protein [Planctomycetota bacterium]